MRGEETVAAARRERDALLARDGWTRKFIGSAPRLLETRELYESIGLEVHLDRLLPGELAEECEGCTLAHAMFRVIYTRPRPPA